MGGVEVSAERHKSDCCSTAGEDQQGHFESAAWKGGVRCSYAVQAMGAWLARCGRLRPCAAGCSQPCHGVCVSD